MTNEEELFVKTLEDLEIRIASSDPYQILGISWLLRKLFMDSRPLVDLVNRSYRQKLLFEITEDENFQMFASGKFPQPDFYSVQDGLDPETARPGKKTRKVKRDGFLGAPLMIIDGHIFTVKDVVSFEANVMGGVHVGVPNSEKDKVAEEISKVLEIGGYQASLRQLKAIGRVVLKTLEPLLLRVKKG